MAYKCRGNLQGKVKAVEMAANDFSLVTLSAKFADKAGGPVALQYKGRTLASDADVKEALDDCYAQKKLFLEVDLRLGGAAMASQAPAAQAQAVAKKEPVRSVVQGLAPFFSSCPLTRPSLPRSRSVRQRNSRRPRRRRPPTPPRPRCSASTA